MNVSKQNISTELVAEVITKTNELKKKGKLVDCVATNYLYKNLVLRLKNLVMIV